MTMPPACKVKKKMVRVRPAIFRKIGFETKKNSNNKNNSKHWEKKDVHILKNNFVPHE